MKVLKWCSDSLKNIYNDFANTRNALNQNTFTSGRIIESELRAILKTGIGSKIVRLKAGYALKDTLLFETIKEEEVYKALLEKSVKKAARYMVGFGRGIIVLYNRGEDISQPISSSFDHKTVQMKVFSGDMVTAVNASLDLMSPRYYKPQFYAVRGFQFHYSRVIDFSYVEPTEFEAPVYQYGGISEFELVYNQLINDSIVERATPSILEKNSTLFYRIEGFKDAMQDERAGPMKEYFTQLENYRSIYGAGLLDKEDEAFTVTQALTNLQEADTISLRRLAMVTGIPLAVLIGENVQGLNSTGENEMQIFQDMIETVQSDYLEEPINELLTKLGMQRISFVENQGRSVDKKIDYETKAILNAQGLYNLGEDHESYLKDKKIIMDSGVDDFFFPEEKKIVEPAKQKEGDLFDA